jgi:phospholipid-binding lipoprotein MlaA
MHSAVEFGDDERILYVSDPWEGFNQNMYKFNYYFDTYAFIPVVKGYEFITPVPVQTGVSNFFNNIGEVKSLYNSILQGKGTKSLSTFTRLIYNSTFGIAGLFDVATGMGLVRQPEDFGQTLGVWGVGSGPYVVLPILGPNTVRSTTGYAVDSGIRMAMTGAIDLYGHMDNGTAVDTAVTALEVVDTRHQLKFRYFKSCYPFEYYMVRYLSKQQREFAIMK